MTAGMVGRIQIINWKAGNSLSYQYFQWAFRFLHFSTFVFKILKLYLIPINDLNPAQYP